MDYRILGPLEVVDDGRAVDLGRPKQRAVLAVLLVQADRVVSVDRLIDLLWGDTDIPRASSALRVYIANLRRCLEPDRPPRTPPEVLVTQAPGYRLRADPDAVDAGRFEALAARGRTLLAEHRPAAARRALVGALALWRGPVLADFADETFAQVEGSRLDQLRAGATEDRLETDLLLGADTTVIAEAEALVSQQPYRERLWELQALALYRGGRQGEALRACATARSILGEELGIQPGPTLRRLEEKILAQSPALEWVPPPAEPDIGGDGPADALIRAAQTVPSGDAAEADGLSNRASLVGRTGEMATLEAALCDVERGSGRVVMVSGEPGIGKTRLVEELAASAARLGATVAWGRCHPAEGAPAYWPWMEVLSSLVDGEDTARLGRALGSGAGDIAQLVPEVKELVDDIVPPPPLDPAAARFRLHQAISDFLGRLSADRPMVIVLDDVHWADAASLQLFRFLAPQGGDHRSLMVGTYRDVDAGEDDGHGLEDTLAALARQPYLVRIALQGLSEPDVGRFMAQTVETQPSLAAVATVHARTEGNPFFVGELARLLSSEGGLAGGDVDAARTSPVPVGVRDVLRRRLARLGAPTNELLSVAAVVGRDFELDVVAAAGAFADDALDLVDPAVAAGLVGEVDGVVGRYRFLHALVQQTVYDGLSSLRRARLHSCVGGAIEALHGDEEVRVVELANHFFHALGAGEGGRAFAYAGRAAEWALSKLAYEQAEDQLVRAIHVLQTLPAGRERAERELAAHLRLSMLLARTKGYAAPEVGRVATRARELCREAGSSRTLLGALSTFVLFSFGRGDFADSSAITEQLVEISAGSSDPAFACAAAHWQGQHAMVEGRFADALGHLERATTIADGLEPSVRAQVFPQAPDVTSRTLLAQVAAFMGHDHLAMTATFEAISVAEALADPFSLSIALVCGAAVVYLSGDPEQARPLADRARRTATEHGFPVFVAISTMVEGWVLAGLGQAEVGVAHILTGLDVFDASGMKVRRTSFLAMLAQAHLYRGSYDDGLAVVDEALAEAAARGEHFYESELLRLRGDLVARRWPSRLEEAEVYLLEAIAVADAQGGAQFRRRADATMAQLGLRAPV